MVILMIYPVLFRPFRATFRISAVPRALPWAGMLLPFRQVPACVWPCS